MNSCIYIDGFALWVVVILVAISFAGFICFANFWIAEVKENDRLRREVEQYAAELEERDRAEYKDNFLRDIMSLDSDTFNERSFKAGFNVGKVLGGNGNV